MRGTLETVTHSPIGNLLTNRVREPCRIAADVFSITGKGVVPMKRIIYASSEPRKVQKMFTLGDFLILLNWIEELQGVDISLSTVAGKGLHLVVGDNVYPIKDIFPGLDWDALE